MKDFATYYRTERQNVPMCIIASLIYSMCLVNLAVAIMLKAGFFAQSQYKLVNAVTVSGLETTSHLFVAALVVHCMVIAHRQIRKSLALMIEAVIASLSLLAAYIAYNSVFMHLPQGLG